MPNILNANGLQTYTRDELLTLFETRMKAIYGNDINLSPDSPDGQMINIFIQVVLDNLDLVKQVYNSFNPDNAIGKILDQRAAINGIQRQGGTFSRTNITLVTSQPLTLFGLDQTANPVYTVSDAQNNEWQLLETISLGSSGTHVLEFQSSIEGEVLTTPNTITQPVTIILGVDSINNPTTQSVIGIDTETDNELKIRRQQSVSLASQGYLTSLVAALKNITGVQEAIVYENNTSATDSDGIPSHSIWVIVSGNYSNEDVANAIYRKRNAGAGMKGGESFTITQVDGSPFIINWDEVDIVPVFVEINLSSISGAVIDYDAIRNGLPLSYIPETFETLNTNRLADFVLDFDDNALITTSGFSETVDGSYTQTLIPSSKDKQFQITSDNVILLPILLQPSAQNIGTEVEIQFSAKGGYGDYTYSLETDNSGASIDASSGLYESGTTAGVDTIRVTDEEGNFSEVNITVV